MGMVSLSESTRCWLWDMMLISRCQPPATVGQGKLMLLLLAVTLRSTEAVGCSPGECVCLCLRLCPFVPVFVSLCFFIPVYLHLPSPHIFLPSWHPHVKVPRTSKNRESSLMPLRFRMFGCAASLTPLLSLGRGRMQLRCWGLLRWQYR